MELTPRPALLYSVTKALPMKLASVNPSVSEFVVQCYQSAVYRLARLSSPLSVSKSIVQSASCQYYRAVYIHQLASLSSVYAPFSLVAIATTTASLHRQRIHHSQPAKLSLFFFVLKQHLHGTCLVKTVDW